MPASRRARLEDSRRCRVGGVVAEPLLLGRQPASALCPAGPAEPAGCGRHSRPLAPFPRSPRPASRHAYASTMEYTFVAGTLVVSRIVCGRKTPPLGRRPPLWLRRRLDHGATPQRHQAHRGQDRRADSHDATTGGLQWPDWVTLRLDAQKPSICQRRGSVSVSRVRAARFAHRAGVPAQRCRPYKPWEEKGLAVAAVHGCTP